MHLNAIALERGRAVEVPVLSRGGRLDALPGRKERYLAVRQIRPTEMNEVHGRDRNSEATGPCSKVGMESWPRKRPRVHPPTSPLVSFTVDDTRRVYYTKNAISSWWWDFHSVEIVRTGWPFQRFYVSACIGACNRWIAQLRAQSGSRSLGRAGRASGTRLIRSIRSFYDRFFVVISEIGIVIF